MGKTADADRSAGADITAKRDPVEIAAAGLSDDPKVVKLAEDHGIADRRTLASWLVSAQWTYDAAEQWPENHQSDDLDKLARPLSAVLSVLAPGELQNLFRLTPALVAHLHPEIRQFDADGTTAEWSAKADDIYWQLTAWMQLAEAIRIVAPKAHLKINQTTVRKPEVQAMAVLAQYWKTIIKKPIETFNIHVHEYVRNGKQIKAREPRGVVPSAVFIFYAMRAIGVPVTLYSVQAYFQSLSPDERQAH